MRLLATFVTAGALIGGLVAAGDAAPRRRGKVVRITRAEPKVATNLRFCQLYDIDVGGCAREVKVGDVGWVLDAEGAYGQAQVIEVSATTDACGTPANWNIVIDMSQLTSKDYSYNAVLVLDHPIAETSRLLPTSLEAPANRLGEDVLQIIDDDGDGLGDVLITNFPCDERGHVAQSYAITHRCTDFWLELRNEWRHARTDVVPHCRR